MKPIDIFYVGKHDILLFNNLIGDVFGLELG